MFRIVICDNRAEDLQILCEGTKQWLKYHTNVNGYVSAFSDSMELQEYLLKKGRKFDLYILDIVMEGIDGIELGKLVRSHDVDVPVVYVTSSSEHALEAYEIQALRYLVKPWTQEALYSALDLAYALFCMRPKHKILISGGDSVTSIIMEEIMYIENNLRNVTYTMNDGHTVVSVRRGGSFESAVGPIAEDSYFVQPHKSFFVNIRYICALQSDVILMDDGRKIPIARRRMADIQDQYIRYISRGGGKAR